MYLTGGQFKGHKIQVPKNTRPTLSKVRESIFNILYQYFENSGTFLDMFAGSGIMGLEAISRGYTVTELEINHKTAEVIKSNYAKIKTSCDIIITDSLKFNTDKKYNIIYIDPPWKDNYLNILQKAKSLIMPDGIIIIEYDSTGSVDIKEITETQDLELFKNKKYGRTMIGFLKLI